MVTRMGPSGDSAVSSEKEMCPAKATCLFRQKLMVFASYAVEKGFSGGVANPVVSSRLRNLKRESCPDASAVKTLAFAFRLNG